MVPRAWRVAAYIPPFSWQVLLLQFKYHESFSRHRARFRWTMKQSLVRSLVMEYLEAAIIRSKSFMIMTVYVFPPLMTCEGVCQTAHLMAKLVLWRGMRNERLWINDMSVCCAAPPVLWFSKRWLLWPFTESKWKLLSVTNTEQMSSLKQLRLQ